MTIDKTEGHHGIVSREVVRIAPLGMEAAKVHKSIKEMNAGHYSVENSVQIVAEPKLHHNCQLCRLEEED
jgi:hypothetical protein